MESPSDVLGVDPDADVEEVERAYRQRVKESHPDHGGSVEEFQLVRRAYEELVTRRRNGEHGTDGTTDRRGVATDQGATRPRGHGRTPPDPPEDTGDGSEESAEEPTEARVEYLNYEVLDDHGWDIDDDDLFEKAAAAGLDPADYGELVNAPDDSVLQAAEARGFAWPYSCRGGACANCAVAVVEGEMSLPVDHILPSEMTDRGFRLSCVGEPTTEELKVVYNVKHLPDLEDLRLPPHPFDRSRASD